MRLNVFWKLQCNSVFTSQTPDSGFRPATLERHPLQITAQHHAKHDNASVGAPALLELPRLLERKLRLLQRDWVRPVGGNRASVANDRANHEPRILELAEQRLGQQRTGCARRGHITPTLGVLRAAQIERRRN